MISKREIILLLLFLVFPAVRNAAGQESFTNDPSVLSNGNWTRIAVTKEGLYRLEYSDLINIGVTNPGNVSIYGNNQGQLSFYNDGKAHDDLKRVAVKIEKGSDNVFGEGDYVVFYGQATHRWNYNHDSGRYEFLRHNYCDTAYYFVTSLPEEAPGIKTCQQPVSAYDYTSTEHDEHYRHELESVNLLGSGREWYQVAYSGVAISVATGFKNIVSTKKLSYSIRVLGRSDTPVSFSFKQGTQSVQTVYPPVLDMADQNGLYASIATAQGSFFPASESPTFNITFSNGGNSSSSGWIDYIDLFARASTVYTSGQMFISDTLTVAPGRITKFVISSQSPAIVWDITDPAEPMQVNAIFSDSEISFTANTDSLRRYVVFTTGSLLSPVLVSDPVVNQDIHSLPTAGMIIVTHPSFRKQAERLALLHSRDDGISSVIVTPQQIYNEFSGGIPDAVAIRNYVKMVWDRSKGTSSPLKYLLLFGDGSYENKVRPPANTSYIPTWQSVTSNIGVQTFTSDDFYGLLDDGEGEADGYLDIGIGRLPVADTADARIVVDKIERYLSSSAFGSWRSTLCLVADDEDNNLHMSDAENLSDIVAYEAPEIITDKIYLDAFKQISSISGNTYPDATEAIKNRIESGSLVLNYVGHGSETGLAHEKVVKADDINSWSNEERLPLFVTATCEFSRFDNVTINPSTGAITANTSAGEMVLLNPDGGGIALMSTTRVVYSAPNYTLNSNILMQAFDSATDGSSMRLGDIIRNAKINSGSGTNKRNFLLLGDPALRLAFPKNGTVVTDIINNVSVESETDTLKALSRITISGHILNSNGALDNSFNGIIEPVVYDKVATITTLANDGGATMSYSVPGNVIFKGVTTVIEGMFSFSFIVPLDINYSYGKGRITYYAWNDVKDVNGSFDDITVGGFSGNSITDTEGPSVNLFMNDTLFRDGDITDASPVLLALLSDESGINVSGTGIGHEIVAWLDDNTSEATVLNSLYSSDPSTISSGRLSYPLSTLDDGHHTITLRAWDNLNNYTQKTLNFIVRSNGSFVLSNVLCYPNPTINETRFSITHNRPDEKLDITITILTLSGDVIRVLRESADTEGYKVPDIIWDCCTESGSRVSGGVYIWKAEATTSAGENAINSGRIIIL